MAEQTTCKVCSRQYAEGDDWCKSPDYTSVCGRLALDPEEDATAEIECLEFTNAQLRVRLREAGDRQRAWGVERAQFERTLGHLRAESRAPQQSAESAPVEALAAAWDSGQQAYHGELMGNPPVKNPYRESADGKRRKK